MTHVTDLRPSSGPQVSALVLCDRLLTLAQDADRAGRRDAAQRLLGLANEVLCPVRPAMRRKARNESWVPKNN